MLATDSLLQFGRREPCMRETQWIEWTRTRLQPQEREELLTASTSEQKAHLLEHDYVWVEGVGVLWNPPHGDPLRRARFTHGTHFQTQRGEFYIDSQGSAREISDHRIDHPVPTAAQRALPEVWSSSGGVGGAQNAKAT
jgi:hypothetical protein